MKRQNDCSPHKYNLRSSISFFIRSIFCIAAILEAFTGFYILNLIDIFLSASKPLKQCEVCILFLGLTVLCSFLKWMRKKLVIQVAWQMENKIHHQLIDSLFGINKLPFSLEQGKLQGLFMAKIPEYRSFIVNNLENLYYWPLVFVFSMIAMTVINWKVSFLILVCVGLCGAFNQWLTSRIPQTSSTCCDRQNELFQFQKELVEQKESIALAAIEDEAIGQYQNRSQACFQAEERLLAKQRDAYVPGLLNEYGPVFLFFLIVIFNASNMSYGQVLALMGLTGKISLPLSQFMRSLAARKRQEPFLEMVHRLTQSTVKLPHYSSLSQAVIEMNNVRFSYEGDQKPVLTVDHFYLNPNEKVILCGKSGSGKSTLVGLLLGDLIPTSGTLGSRYATPEKMWKHIGYVDGGNCVFDGSLIKNITFQEQLAPKQQKKYDQLITTLHLEHIAANHTPVMNLSGGEKQKIALARALFREPEFLILDEPLAAVDAASEKEIIDFLCELDIGMLIISHRSLIWKLGDRCYEIKESAVYEA